MRVGLDTLSIIPGRIGGGETYVVNLYRLLPSLLSEHEFVFFTSPANRHLFPVGSPRAREVRCAVPPRPALRMLWEQAILPAQIRRHRIDLIHFPANFLSLAAPVRTLLTVHDLSLEFYARQMPDAYPRTAANRLRRFFYIQSPRRASHVVTDSAWSRRQLVELAGIAVNRISMVPLGVDMPAGPRPHPLGDGARPYVLFVGSQMPHKNIPCLVEAFAELRRELDLSHLLVLVGRPGWGTAAVQQAIDRQGIREAVIQEHEADNDRVQGWYAHADLFAFPSLYEGFGLPPLEAMAHGVPVICSDAASLPEVVGDAAMQFDPRSVAACKEALRRGLSDEGWRRQAGVSGREHASTFTWDRAARAMLSLMDRAAHPKAEP